MRGIARACVLALLVIVGMTAAGCIHTWTQTYHDYPPEAYTDPAHSRTMADPGEK